MAKFLVRPRSEWSDRLRRPCAMLFIVTTDLPARADLMNMKNFNGKWACHLCKDMGVAVGTGLHRVWPLDKNNELRTEDDQREYSESATQQKPVMGCKGVSVFYRLKSKFSLTTGFALDWMHNVPLGVTKYFFSPSDT